MASAAADAHGKSCCTERATVHATSSYEQQQMGDGRAAYRFAVVAAQSSCELGQKPLRDGLCTLRS
jgi:hypothetical protein